MWNEYGDRQFLWSIIEILKITPHNLLVCYMLHWWFYFHCLCCIYGMGCCCAVGNRLESMHASMKGLWGSNGALSILLAVCLKKSTTSVMSPVHRLGQTCAVHDLLQCRCCWKFSCLWAPRRGLHVLWVLYIASSCGVKSRVGHTIKKDGIFPEVYNLWSLPVGLWGPWGLSPSMNSAWKKDR